MRILQGVAMFTVLLAVAIPRSAIAQDRRETDHEGEDDKSCEKAAKIVSKGHSEKKYEWALGYTSVCGKLGADALVAAIPQQMNVTDTLALESFFSTVDNWRDGAVMAAALELAGNPSASVQARVFSVRYLVTLVDKNVKFLYGDISASPTTSTSTIDGATIFSRPCLAAHVSDWSAITATQLPASYVSIIKAAMANIASASSTPVPVRNAAACAQW